MNDIERARQKREDERLRKDVSDLVTSLDDLRDRLPFDNFHPRTADLQRWWGPGWRWPAGTILDVNGEPIRREGDE